ncbi:hypothetical protein G7046_g272 [Stylonectria norvegica]|nr:hypothetical protein G7046_g272 [Stylonectria norvegica]
MSPRRGISVYGNGCIVIGTEASSHCTQVLLEIVTVLLSRHDHGHWYNISVVPWAREKKIARSKAQGTRPVGLNWTHTVRISVSDWSIVTSQGQRRRQAATAEAEAVLHESWMLVTWSLSGSSAAPSKTHVAAHESESLEELKTWRAKDPDRQGSKEQGWTGGIRVRPSCVAGADWGGHERVWPSGPALSRELRVEPQCIWPMPRTGAGRWGPVPHRTSTDASFFVIFLHHDGFSVHHVDNSQHLTMRLALVGKGDMFDGGRHSKLALQAPGIACRGHS